MRTSNRKCKYYSEGQHTARPATRCHGLTSRVTRSLVILSRNETVWHRENTATGGGELCHHTPRSSFSHRAVTFEGALVTRGVRRWNARVGPRCIYLALMGRYELNQLSSLRLSYTRPFILCYAASAHISRSSSTDNTHLTVKMVVSSIPVNFGLIVIVAIYIHLVTYWLLGMLPSPWHKNGPPRNVACLHYWSYNYFSISERSLFSLFAHVGFLGL